MLPKIQIKGHAKYAVYSHLFSCFIMIIISSLVPTIVTTVVSERLVQGISITFEEVEAYIMGTLDKMSEAYAKVEAFVDEYTLAQGIVFVTNIINLPFQYLLMRYFLVLAGTPADKVCSFRVYFSGMENVTALIKGAVIMLLFDLLTTLGIVVGFFPVYLAFCMAPFYFALDPTTGIFKAFSKSRALMKGHKKEAFVILLEFILVIIGSSVLEYTGMGFLAFPIQALARSLMFTTLAVIFVKLDRDSGEQGEPQTQE